MIVEEKKKELFLQKTLIPVGIAVLFMLVWAWPGAHAAVYKYKDENGAWHFSDAPITLPEQSETMTGMVERSTQKIDLRVQLTTALRPQNDIEKAVTSVVAIKSTIGLGSGFFISGNGFIVTNKHVLQFTDDQEKKVDTMFGEAESKIRNLEERLNQEQAQLNNAKRDLDKTKAFIDAQPNSTVKDLNKSRYFSDFQSYVAWEENFYKRKKKFLQHKKELWNKKISYKREAGIAALSQTFTVYLADNTELIAYLVKRSDNFDLALLKVDGVTAPFLEPAIFSDTSDGDAAYAIGNPIKLRNSVAAGVISGYESDFVKTDAKIYPGNSGGPLVTKDGKVLGVNTYKEITHKFEGLGFAVTIERVMMEFGGFLR